MDLKRAFFGIMSLVLLLFTVKSIATGVAYTRNVTINIQASPEQFWILTSLALFMAAACAWRFFRSSNGDGQ